MRASVASVLALAASSSATIYYAGVAESGGEFGAYSSTAVNGTGLPGTFNKDYAFLNTATLDTWITQNGINTFRVAFLLERMCPLAYGLGKKFNETYFGYFDDAIQAITAKKAYAILDPHNYMRYNDPSQQPTTGSVIGNTTDPIAATTKQFRQFWKELASRYVDNEYVIFGIMNEPHDMPTSLIVKNDQAAINAIRSTGAKQLILAPGNGYTGGHSWTQSTGGNDPNSEWLYKLTDPLNNTAMDVHEYLDSDYSGSHTECVNAFPKNLAPLTAWLKQYNLKAFVSEFGGNNNTKCDTQIKGAINYMANNPEYIGWTAWAAGPFWGTYSPCCDNYGNSGSLEPGSTAAGGGPSYYTTIWQKVIQPLVPKTLQKTGIATLSGGK